MGKWELYLGPIDARIPYLGRYSSSPLVPDDDDYLTLYTVTYCILGEKNRK